MTDQYQYDDGPGNTISNHECCLFTLPVTVKNCGDFRVYHIGPTQSCSIAFCSAPQSKDSNLHQSWLGTSSAVQNTAILNEVSISLF